MWQWLALTVPIERQAALGHVSRSSGRSNNPFEDSLAPNSSFFIGHSIFSGMGLFAAAVFSARESHSPLDLFSRGLRTKKTHMA